MKKTLPIWKGFFIVLNRAVEKNIPNPLPALDFTLYSTPSIPIGTAFGGIYYVTNIY
jgi:hypothetical protein